MTRFFQLDSTFFGLSYSYKAHFEQELFYCVKHLNMSYEVAYRLPVHKRRFMLNALIAENEKQKERYDEEMQAANGGPKTLSGDNLKSYLNNNGNPT